MNESVIICEPSSSKKLSKNRKVLQKLRRSKQHEIGRSPERRLDDRFVDDCNQNTPPTTARKNPKRRRSGSDQSPAKKHQKRISNETIILSDDDDTTSTPEIVLISSQESVKPEKPILRRSVRQQLRIKAAQVKKKASPKPEKTLPKEDDDLTVVWSSSGLLSSEKPVKVPADLSSSEQPENTPAESSIFFLDTTGDARNLNANCLSPMQDTWFPCLLPESAKLSPIKAKRKQPKKPCVTVSPKAAKSKSAKSSSGKALKAAEKEKFLKRPLREIIIDGSNVGYGFSHNKEFTKTGLQLVLDFFQARGHVVKIFLPQHYRKRDRLYLEDWYNDGQVVFTPSRKIGGKQIVPYDDRFIIEYATRCKGIVVSSDQFRDLWKEKPEWRDTIANRLLPPTFAGECVLFPEDPLGRDGPTLDIFLRHDSE